METTYTRDAQTRRTGSGRRRRSVGLAPRERRRLVQLMVCAALFLTVFFGRGVFPAQLEAIRADVLGVIQSDTDFRAAFAHLGQSISQGEPVGDTLGDLCVDVFAGGQQTVETVEYPSDHARPYHEELTFLASNPAPEDILERRFGHIAPVQSAIKVPPEPSPPPEAAPTEGVLPTQPQPVYSGPPLPDGATMERVELGLAQTAAPVTAVTSSIYGWREHPLEGGEKFHSGVDLAADYGSAIGAFAEGVVDYIGESPAYGQYLQLRHANGVTTFYAHCSKLCVRQGQQVAMGERVAEVGNTGNVTGTHLHFELKENGTFLNPLYYIETLS